MQPHQNSKHSSWCQCVLLYGCKCRDGCALLSSRLNGPFLCPYARDDDAANLSSPHTTPKLWQKPRIEASLRRDPTTTGCFGTARVLRRAAPPSFTIVISEKGQSQQHDPQMAAVRPTPCLRHGGNGARATPISQFTGVDAKR